MTQVALLLALHVLGLLVCLAWGPRRYPVVCSALAFPIGLATAAGLAVASLYVGAPLFASVVGGSCAILAAAIWVAHRRWQLGRFDLFLLGAGGAVFVGIAALFTRYDVTFFIYESHKLVLIAQTFGTEATSLDGPLLKLLSELGPLPIAAYGLAGLGDLGFLQALHPTLLACVVAAVAAIAERGAALLGAPRWVRMAGFGLGTAALVFNPAVLHSGLCVVSASFVSAYVTCFLGVWWLAEIRGDATTIPVALLGLVALFLVSDVASLFGLVLFAVAVLPSRLADGDLDVPVGVAVGVLIAFLGASGIDFPDTDTPAYFSLGEAQRLLGGLLAVYVLWVVTRANSIRRFVRALPAAFLAAATAATAIGIVAGLAGLDDSAASAWDSLRQSSWIATWPLVMVLASVGLLAGRMPGERLLVSIVPICGLAVLWIGRGATPEFFAPFGDLQMLTTAAFSIALLYLVLKAGWVLGGTRATAREAVPSGRPGRELGIAAASLLAGLLAFNLHGIAVAQTRIRGHRLSPIDSPSIVDAARTGYGSSSARNKYAVYYMVAARTHGGSVRLLPELMHHAPYFRHLAGLKVTAGPAFLPARAAAILRPQVDESWKFDLEMVGQDSGVDAPKGSDLRAIHFIWEEGVRDWILAITPDKGPVFWLPHDLYLKSGGTP